VVNCSGVVRLAEAKHEAKKIEKERNKQQFSRPGNAFQSLA